LGTTAQEFETTLRIRVCGSPMCRATFFVCATCDRGQRYCSHACRDAVRRQQLRAASRRYQQGEPGRNAHRNRQRRYRERQADAGVTHQGPETITSPASQPSPTPHQCTICGRSSRWIDPFPAIPGQRRRRDRQKPVGRSPKNYVFR